MMEGLGMGRQRVGSGEVERGVVRQGGCGLLFHSLLSGPQPYLVASALKHAPIDIEDMKSCGVFDVFDNENASKNLKVILRRYQTGAEVLYSECHAKVTWCDISQSRCKNLRQDRNFFILLWRMARNFENV